MKCQTVYCFHPKPWSGAGSPWVYARLHKAQKERDAMLLDGAGPGPIWVRTKEPDRPLQCAFIRDGYTVRQVLGRINRVLKREGLGGGETFGAGMDRAVWDSRWDSYQGSRAVYAVTGNNEGHWVHIDIMLWKRDVLTATTIATLKTFNGQADALAIANRVTQLLAA